MAKFKIRPIPARKTHVNRYFEKVMIADDPETLLWRPIIRTEKGLARWTSIYKKREADDLTEDEEAYLRSVCERANFEMQEVE